MGRDPHVQNPLADLELGGSLLDDVGRCETKVRSAAGS